MVCNFAFSNAFSSTLVQFSRITVLKPECSNAFLPTVLTPCAEKLPATALQSANAKSPMFLTDFGNETLQTSQYLKQFSATDDGAIPLILSGTATSFLPPK